MRNGNEVSEGEPCVARGPLRIGDVAPNFTARSTLGSMALDQYRGQWVILFSHPADFTPVCTSEFLALAQAQQDFVARGCQLLGLSVDSLFSHFAWLRAIHDRFQIAVRFPLIEDPTLTIARAYGMVAAGDDDASASRTTFFIDPDGVIQATQCYPATVGRSVDEMLRTLDALLAVNDGHALAPANWRAGEPLLQAPASDLDSILAGEGAMDWFYPSTGS